MLTDDRGTFFDGVMKSLKANSPTSMNFGGRSSHFEQFVLQKKTNKYLEKLISLIMMRVALIRAERTASVRPGKDSTSEKCLDFQGSTHHWRSVLGPRTRGL